MYEVADLTPYGFTPEEGGGWAWVLPEGKTSKVFTLHITPQEIYGTVLHTTSSLLVAAGTVEHLPPDTWGWRIRFVERRGFYVDNLLATLRMEGVLEERRVHSA